MWAPFLATMCLFMFLSRSPILLFLLPLMVIFLELKTLFLYQRKVRFSLFGFIAAICVTFLVLDFSCMEHGIRFQFL